MAGAATREVTYVIKSSKLCNLRCRYCYEFAELARPDRMAPAQLRRMFANIGDYYAAKDVRDRARTLVRFVWHGGEPMLIEPGYYWQAFADQKDILGTRVGYLNSVQTNATVLDEARIRLLRDGFDRVGVSIDLFGGLRVNVGGRDLQQRVLANMDRLREAGVNFGCITVLHRGNVAHVDRIWHFYERARTPFRVLPLFAGATPDQNRSHELSADEIIAAMRRLVDLWLSSPSPVPVAPISGHITSLMRHFNPDHGVRRYYNKSDWCWVILVNTNGACYTDGDPYGGPEWNLGNIFTTPLAEIFGGEAFGRSVAETDKRIAANCLNCPYFGGCDGLHVGDHMDNIYEYRDGIGVCRLDRALLAHLEHRLRQAGLVDAAGRLRLTDPTAAEARLDPVA